MAAVAVHAGLAAAGASFANDVLASKHCPNDHRRIAPAIMIGSGAYLIWRRAPFVPFMVGYFGLYVSLQLGLALREHNFPAISSRGPPPPNVKISIF